MPPVKTLCRQTKEEYWNWLHPMFRFPFWKCVKIIVQTIIYGSNNFFCISTWLHN